MLDENVFYIASHSDFTKPLLKKLLLSWFESDIKDKNTAKSFFFDVSKIHIAYKNI